jgi:hypothetical protein
MPPSTILASALQKHFNLLNLPEVLQREILNDSVVASGTHKNFKDFLSQEAVHRHLWGAKKPSAAIALAGRSRFRKFGATHPIVVAGNADLWDTAQYCDAIRDDPEMLGWARAKVPVVRYSQE